MTFADFAAEWLSDYARAHVRPKTYEGYEGVLRVHLVPHFGQLQLAEISRKSIDAFVADWSTGGPAFQRRLAAARLAEADRARGERRDPRPVRLGHSPKTIANALVPLREMLGHAVEWGYLNANPAAGVRRPRVESRHDDMRCLERGRSREAPRARIEGGACVPPNCGDDRDAARRAPRADLGRRRLERSPGLGSGGASVRAAVVQQPKTRGSVRAIAMTRDPRFYVEASPCCESVQAA